MQSCARSNRKASKGNNNKKERVPKIAIEIDSKVSFLFATIECKSVQEARWI